MIRSDEKWIWRWKNKFKACYSVWRNEWLSLVEREREKKSWRFILLIHATRELLPWCLHILDKPCNFTVTTLLFFFFEYFHQYCSKSCSYLAIYIYYIYILIQIDIYIYIILRKRRNEIVSIEFIILLSFSSKRWSTLSSILSCFSKDKRRRSVNRPSWLGDDGPIGDRGVSETKIGIESIKIPFSIPSKSFVLFHYIKKRMTTFVALSIKIDYPENLILLLA